jgi:hypothetical protein
MLVIPLDRAECCLVNDMHHSPSGGDFRRGVVSHLTFAVVVSLTFAVALSLTFAVVVSLPFTFTWIE